MSEKTKRIIPLMLALMFIFGALPFSVLPVYAKVVSAATQEALTAAVSAGGDVKLTDNIVLSAELIIPEGKTVSLNLNGKTLSRELESCVENGGVIRVNPGATLTVTDSSGTNLGTIKGGASFNGGGICNQGTLIFESGTIENCKALHSEYGCGGGIYNDGINGSEASLTLRGGIIRNNTARNGGGVYNGASGTLIIENKVTTKKSGTQAKEIITNVSITGNTAESEGSGIYNLNAMSIGNAPEITGNKNYDIFLADDKIIAVTSELSNTGKIRVKASGSNRIITRDYGKYNTKMPGDLFACADTSAVIMLTGTENGEIMFKNDAKTIILVFENSKLIKKEETDSSDFAGIWSKAIGYAKENKCVLGDTSDDSVVEITLGNDCSYDTQLYAEPGRNIVLDLNGHCIKRAGKKQKNGSLFKVGERAKLTIKDSNPDSDGYSDHKGGVIADGNGDDCGGGVILQAYAQFYMLGGTIYNCKTNYHGGAVYAGENSAKVIMQDCTIDSCITKDSSDDCHGGGIYVKNASSIILKNVVIKNCSSEDKGGGLYLREKPRNVNLKNVTFENNSAADGGGAIFIDDLKSDTEFTFEADSCTFKNNKSDKDGGAVYVYDDDEYKSHNATIFRNCIFTENETKKDGGAMEVNDNGVVISGGTFTGNNATGKGGAIYVEGEYDISVAGKLVVKDNDGKDNFDNLCLEENSDHKAYIYDAGLYPGSEIYVCTSNNKTGITAVKDVSEYQSKYFHAENGTLSFNKTGTKTAAMVTASLFGEGSKTVLYCLGGAAILAVAAVIIAAIKKKGAVTGAGDDDE